MSNMTLQEKKQQIIDDFSIYEEWLDKYEYLIELGKSLEPFPEEKKTEDRLIKGCQSRVWLDSELRDGLLYFRADSDAITAARPRKYRPMILLSCGKSGSRTTCPPPGPTGLCP